MIDLQARNASDGGVEGRDVKASDEPGLRHPPLDLTQRAFDAPVAPYMGARARYVRPKDLQDRLGLTPKPTTAGLAPESHLAAVQIPEAT